MYCIAGLVLPNLASSISSNCPWNPDSVHAAILDSYSFVNLDLEFLPRIRQDLLEIRCIAKILDGWMSVGTVHLVLDVVVFGDECLVEFLVSA